MEPYKKSKFLLLFVLMIHCLISFSQNKIIDTFYFNEKWQICEKPVASYYRIGAISTDSSWFYTGKVKDYYKDGKLQMEGEYSADGHKNGNFIFYFPDGKIEAMGKFEIDKPADYWMYHTGNSEYRIYFPLGESSFVVMDYTDSMGKMHTKNGKGKFEITVLDSEGLPFRLEANSSDSARDGTWRYYHNDYAGDEKLFFKEYYDKGVFKKGESLSYYGVYASYSEPRMRARLPFLRKLRITERFSADESFHMNNNASDAIADFLKTKKLPGINAEGKSFEESFRVILGKLNSSAYRFDYRNKNYSGKIDFFLSDSGYLQNVEVTGDIQEKEKQYLLSTMQLFKNVHELIIENVGIDGWHTIYFYTIDLSFYFPQPWQNYVGREMIFSFLKKEELVVLIGQLVEYLKKH